MTILFAMATALDVSSAEEVDKFIPPAEITLFPAGKTIKTRDNRVFRNPNPQGLIDIFHQEGVDLPVDINHLSETSWGHKETPAIGWINDVTVAKDGSIMGKIKWNDHGLFLLQSQAYRYISLAFWTEKDKITIRKIASAGLGTSPALSMRAVASRQALNEEQEAIMDPLDEIRKIIGVKDDDNVAMVKAVAALKRKADKVAVEPPTKAMPDLAHFVPRADYDKGVMASKMAKEEIRTTQVKAHQSKVNEVIKGALDDGKITPSSEAFYRGTCNTDEGLKQFQDFISTAPAIASKTDDPGRPEQGNAALSSEEKSICAALDIDEKEYAKNQVLKPLVYQERLKPVFTSMIEDDSDRLFWSGDYVWGVKSRGNAGYAFWQMAFGSQAALDATNFNAARTAMMSLKNEHKRPLNIKPTLLVVSPSNGAAAREPIKAEMTSTGATNTNRDLVDIFETPWLA